MRASLLDAGADRVVVGTAAWPDPTPWLELGDALVLALDVRDGEVRTAGWTERRRASLRRRARARRGPRVLVTAIDRDGTLTGPDVELVRRAAGAGARVLAAGGIRDAADVAALAEAGAEAARSSAARCLLAGRTSPPLQVPSGTSSATASSCRRPFDVTKLCFAAGSAPS